jgi:hypothetical protein
MPGWTCGAWRTGQSPSTCSSCEESLRFSQEMAVITAPFGSASNYATGDARVYVFISYALKGSAAG